MKPIQVGERVAVYEGGNRYKGTVAQVGDPLGSKNIRVEFVFMRTDWFHLKQCRRLKPKAKPQPPREWVLVRHTQFGTLSVRDTDWIDALCEPAAEVIRVREVKS